MLSILQAAAIGVPLLLLLLLTVSGAILAAEPLIGALLLALLAVFVRAGFRASRDQRRSRWFRRLALAWAAGGALFGLASIPFAFTGAAYDDFARWHSTGAGLKAGMTVDEARALLARRSTVTDLAVDYPKGFKGTRFQVEPTGLASFQFEFPLAELYYLDVAVDKDGRVVEVKPWRD
jgi:hypothetical protein